MTGKEIERVGKPTVIQLVQSMAPEIEKALPAHLDAKRIARIALTLLRGNRQLAECEPESFVGALMTASQLGLEPGPLGEAYLVPFGKQVTFIPGYRGLIKLAYQSGQVHQIGAHIVYSGDEFDYTLGLKPTLHHKPAMTDRGEEVGVYAVAHLASGKTPFVVLTKAEVEKLRARSRAANNGPWKTDREAMVRKTAVRQLARWLPLSPDLRDLAVAVGMEGSVRRQWTSERPDQDAVEFEEPLELPAAGPQVTTESIQAGVATARHQAAQQPPPLTQEQIEAEWHTDGHPTEGQPRRVWNPECALCPFQRSAEGEPLARCYYGHSEDYLDDCPSCQREKAWKADDAAGGGT